MPEICFNLTFDSASENAIRAIWQRLTDVGLVVGGLTGYRPHIELASYQATNPTLYKTALVALAAATASFPVRFESLGIFPETGVLFLAPRMSQDLFMLHRKVLQGIDTTASLTMIDDFSLPNRWTPHCTLVGRLTTPDLLTAIEYCQHTWIPIRGHAVGIGMRLYPAVDDHQFYAFRQPENA